MNSPITGKAMTLHQEQRCLKFRKETFEIIFHAYKCEDTGELFENEEFATLNYNQLVNQYRAKYHIPFPEEIIDTRKKYGISAKRMSEILGFGVNVYRQYESGEVPNLSNAKLIQLIEDPVEFKRLVQLSAILTDPDKIKINKGIEELIAKKEAKQADTELKKYLFGHHLPSVNSGFKAPKHEKFIGMVVFFSQHLHPWKTKLNKLLFYSDFMMYRRYAYSISGTQYRAIPMGPVPEKYHSLFEYLTDQKIVTIETTAFNEGGIGEQFRSSTDYHFNPQVFDKRELDVLTTVLNHFKNFSTQEIIDSSHHEKAWLNNKDERSLIDYTYSFDLKTI